MSARSVAVITGAAGAIGAEMVARYASEGHLVHLVDRSPAVIAGAEAVGGTAHVLDVTDPEAVAELAAIERIDVLVNGVGVWPLVPFDDLDPVAWRSYVDVNLNAAYSVIWSCRAGLRAAEGAVVNVASAMALKGHEQMTHYAASKAGMIGMTRSLARALGPDGVRVNAVAPGLVATPQARESWGEDGAAAFRATRSLNVDITVRDVVEAVAFLGSPAARVITGQTLVVDGGTVLH